MTFPNDLSRLQSTQTWQSDVKLGTLPHRLSPIVKGNELHAAALWLHRLLQDIQECVVLVTIDA
jgi:hypothetical protein